MGGRLSMPFYRSRVAAVCAAVGLWSIVIALGFACALILRAPAGAVNPLGGGAVEAGAASPNSVQGAEMAMRTWAQAYGARMMVESSKSKMHQRGPTDVPLAKDSPMPPLEAAGWLNGDLKAEDIQGKVLVVDVWDGGCPYCSMSAPSLLEVYNKYRDQGVVFLGITSADEDDASQFVDTLGLPWPNAYDAGETIDRLGANGPTVFVVAPDGRVAWNDDKARFRHDLWQYGDRLDRAIQQAVRSRDAEAATQAGG